MFVLAGGKLVFAQINRRFLPVRKAVSCFRTIKVFAERFRRQALKSLAFLPAKGSDF